LYTGPSPRNLGLSILLHGTAIAALLYATLPTPPSEVSLDGAQPTEIRIRGKLYYVSQIEGSNSTGTRSEASRGKPTSTKTAGKSGGIAAPQAQSAGRSAAPKPTQVAAVTPTPVPAPAPAAASEPAPAPVPDKIRTLRQQARAFVAPEVRPKPTATQTLIQPLSPPDLAPPPTPLPNFRVLTDVSQMRKIPKPFEAPGRRTPATPPQSPLVTAPAMELVPLAPAPVGDPLAVLSLNDHPIPFNEKVVVPPGNVAQPPLESTGPAGVAGSAPTNNAAGNGTAREAGAAGKSSGANGAPGNAGAASNGAAGNGSGSAPGNGRAAIGNGTGAALVGGGKDGSTVAVVGGNGGTPGSAGSNGAGSAAAGSGASGVNAGGAGGTSEIAGAGGGVGVGAAGAGSGTGAGRATLGSTTINRPPTGNFDAVVVQSSPTDQYPESRGLLSGRPIYSVYIPMGTSRDWTLFFCIPGDKPESSNTPVVQLGPLGAPVKAPYPTKLVKPVITLPSYERYILVHGTVSRDGKFESLRLVRSIKPETDQALLAALAAWEFRAATRDGVAIAVEFLLSIPAKGL
jgi:hypothetical protein